MKPKQSDKAREASVAQAIEQLEQSKLAEKTRATLTKATKCALAALLVMMAGVGLGVIPVAVVPVMSAIVVVQGICAFAAPLMKWRADDTREEAQTTIRAILPNSGK